MDDYCYVVVRVHKPSGRHHEVYETISLRSAKSYIASDAESLGHMAEDLDYIIVVYQKHTNYYVGTMYNEQDTLY